MDQKLVRCIEGHVYDSARNEHCPLCGARALAKGEDPAKHGSNDTPLLPIETAREGANLDDQSQTRRTPIPTLNRPTLLIGAAAVAVVLLFVGVWASGVFGPSETTHESASLSGSTTGAAPVEAKTQHASTNQSTPSESAHESGAGATGEKQDARQSSPAAATECDRLAMSPFDLDRIAGVSGVRETFKIDPAVAVHACEEATRSAPSDRLEWANLARSYRAARNDIAAVAAYRKATELGSVFGAYGLGVTLRANPAMQRDPSEARRLLEGAARAGLPPAMSEYATVLASGVGAPVDATQARSWYEKAAAADFTPAMNTLAFYLLNGSGKLPVIFASERASSFER